MQLNLCLPKNKVLWYVEFACVFSLAPLDASERSGWRGDVARFPFMAMLTTVPDTQQLDQRKIRIACVSHQTCSTDM